MKANELRIGNWISHELGTCTVRGTTKNGIWLNDMGGPILLDGFMNIQPIPLTEYILLKCGFDEIKDSDYKYRVFEIKDWGKIKLVNGILETAEYYFLDGLNYEIKYLHQLQNLYFSLTNKELTITL